MFRFFKHRRWLGRGLLLGMVPLATAGCHGHGYHRTHDDMSEEEMQSEKSSPEEALPHPHPIG